MLAGYQAVFLGGVANGTVIASGGYEFVRGTTNGTIIDTGGFQYVDVARGPTAPKSTAADSSM